VHTDSVAEAFYAEHDAVVGCDGRLSRHVEWNGLCRTIRDKTAFPLRLCLLMLAAVTWGALGLFFIVAMTQCVSSQERGAHVAERYAAGSRQAASVILSQKSDCKQ
jgi:hypothetical protein